MSGNPPRHLLESQIVVYEISHFWFFLWKFHATPRSSVCKRFAISTLVSATWSVDRYPENSEESRFQFRAHRRVGDHAERPGQLLMKNRDPGDAPEQPPPIVST